jgi:hypothetical protein
MTKTLALLVISSIISIGKSPHTPGPAHFYGAWEMKWMQEDKQIKTVKIYTQDYFIYSTYSNDEYINSGGGTWKLKSNGIEETFEFNTTTTDLVGTTLNYAFDGDHDDIPLKLMYKGENQKTRQVWEKVDDGHSPLFGAWRITQRERNGQMNVMQQGPRKTMKVLSGTRFQWAAFNVETRQFSGTGGGTFTAEDGKYIENIEFFSRDNSRVGASLQFDFEVKGKDWHHKGLSSKGAPIYEIWTNQDQ